MTKHDRGDTFVVRLATFKGYTHNHRNGPRPNLIKLAASGFYLEAATQEIRCSRCHLAFALNNATSYVCTQCRLSHTSSALNVSRASTSCLHDEHDDSMTSCTSDNTQSSDVIHDMQTADNADESHQELKEPKTCVSASGCEVTVDDLKARPWVHEVQKLGFSDDAVCSVLTSRLLDAGKSAHSGPISLVRDLHDYQDKADGIFTCAATGKVNKDAASVTHKSKSRRKNRRNKGNSHKKHKMEPHLVHNTDHVMSPSMQALHDKLEVLEDQHLCKVCVDDAAEVVFLPCGHMCCCTVCAAQMVNCPVCRTTVASTIRIQPSQAVAYP